MRRHPSVHDQISIDNPQFLCMIRYLLIILSFSARNILGLISSDCVLQNFRGGSYACT